MQEIRRGAVRRPLVGRRTVQSRRQPDLAALRVVKRSGTVYEQLHTYIVRHAAGGEQLLESALAARFGVSKTPVREALYRLAGETLVDLVPNKGYFVHRATYEDVRQVLEIREALEGMATRLATPRLTDEDLRSIHAKFEPLAELLREGRDPGMLTMEMKAANDVLHDTLLRVARNARIMESMRQLRAQMEYMVRVMAVPARYAVSYDEHLTIIAALDRRDPDSAEVAMRRHVASLKNDMLKLF